MDKFTVISISVRLCNLKQYPDLLISLSSHLTHTVKEFYVRVLRAVKISVTVWAPHNKRNREQRTENKNFKKSCIVEYTVSDRLKFLFAVLCSLFFLLCRAPYYYRNFDCNNSYSFCWIHIGTSYDARRIQYKSSIMNVVELHYECFEAFDWSIGWKNFTNWPIKKCFETFVTVPWPYSMM